MDGFALILFLVLVFGIFILYLIQEENEEKKKKVAQERRENENIKKLSTELNKKRAEDLLLLYESILRFRDILLNNYKIPVCRRCHSLLWNLDNVIGPSDSFSNKIKLLCHECNSQKTIKPFDTIVYTKQGDRLGTSIREIFDKIIELQESIKVSNYIDSDNHLYKTLSTRIDIKTENLFKNEVSKIDPDEQFFKPFLNKLIFTNALVFKTNEENFLSEHSRSSGRHILSAVRKKIWERDGGRCINCGSKKSLHYDHIIPYSKGGSNTEKNIQLLCQECNLRKSDSIV